MELIEQAVFTSAETDRAAGYQVVATSPGVSEADAQELAVWGPSHDALLESSPNAVSYNFHPLASGSYCVSRTAPAGWEYSGRGGVRVYTQCLIVAPATLARFANNPFALLRAALAAGSLRLHDEVPKRLVPLRLAGRGAVVDSALLARLSTNPGPDWLASLVQAALTSPAVAVVGGPPAEHAIAGLINCLPPVCRPQFSFSTGLKFSLRRPFRAVALSGNREEQRRVQRLYNVAVLDFSGPLPAEFAPVESWARFIQRVLKSGRTSLLAHRLSSRQYEFTPEDLPALGLQLLEELDAVSLDNDPPNADEPSGHAPPADEWLGELPEADEWIGEASREHFLANDRAPIPDDFPPKPIEDDAPAHPAPRPAEVVRQAHEAHPRYREGSCSSACGDCQPSAPSQLLDPDDPEVLEKLEHLDDLVYDAISGRSAAMEELKTAWPRLRDELGDELLAESQEQYLHYALSTWVGSIEPEAIRNPARAVQSLEVLCVLFDQIG